MSRPFIILLIVLATFFWGGSFIVSKYVVLYLPPLIGAVARFSIAMFILICIVFYWKAYSFKALKENILAYFLMGLLGIAVFNFCLFLGLKYTSPVNGALIMATNPLVTLLLTALLFRDPIRMNQKLGILLSFIGVAIVLTDGQLKLLLTLDVSIGDGIIMIGNICFAFYSIINKRMVKYHNPLFTTTISMLIGTCLLALCLPFEPGSLSMLMDQPLYVYLSILYLAVFGSVLAYLFWNSGTAHLGARQVSVFFNLVPIFTVLISAVMGIPMTLLQLLGGAMVILGVTISLQSPAAFKQKPIH